MAAALQIIRHGKTISVFRFLVLTLPAVDPVFCTNRRNYLREKIAKNAIFALPPTSRLLSAPLPFLFILSFPKPPCERKYTCNDTSFRGDFYSSCYSSFIGTNITGTGYKSHGNDFGPECRRYEDKDSVRLLRIILKITFLLFFSSFYLLNLFIYFIYFPLFICLD